jgi:hypothetical protein
MSTTQNRMRASDADRDAVLAQLSENYQAGRLTSDELEERTGQALAAKTFGDLESLMTDLPGPAPAPAPGPVSAPAPGLAPAWISRPVLPLAIVALVAVSVVATVAGGGHGHHAWDLWWVLPVALFARRFIAGRRF